MVSERSEQERLARVAAPRDTGRDATLPQPSDRAPTLADGAPVPQRDPERDPSHGSWWQEAGWLVLVLLAGLGVRAWIISDPALGHQSDLRLFTNWAAGLASLGLREFYAAFGFCDYPPIGVLLLAGIGSAGQWLSSFEPDGLRMLVKSAASLADVIIALLLFVEGRRLLGRGAAVLAAGLYFLNPVVIYDSAYWGQVDAVFTMFLVGGLICIGRSWWGLAGAASAAALLAKFQAIAILPILLFEAYRLGGWRAMRRIGLGSVSLAVAVLAPFALTDTLDDVLTRAYVNTVGQYRDVAKGAYNIWPIITDPKTPDTAVPNFLVKAAAAGDAGVSRDASWLLSLNWRRISLIGYALVVAIVLSLYSLRPGQVARFGAAGLLALAFFLFPTEMHERYAFPAMAFLALWAASDPRYERIYMIASGILLLNLAAILPAAPLAQPIGAAAVAVFAFAVLSLFQGPRAPARSPARAVAAATDERQPVLVRAFRWGTAGAVVAALVVGGWIGKRVAEAPHHVAPADAMYLSALPPRQVEQGWGTLAADQAVAGGAPRLGDVFYQRAIGTHAPSRLRYDVPAQAAFFAATVGIDHGSDNQGSVVVSIEVDGQRVYVSPLLRSGTAPPEIRVPVEGATEIVLVAHETKDGPRCDHVTWALARFEYSGAHAITADQPRLARD